MRLLLTSSPLLDLLRSLGGSSRPLLLLLLGSAAVEVLDNHPDEHVQDEEADEEKEGDEVDEPPFVVVLFRLLVQSHGVQTMVHDVHPAVLGGEDKERHERLSKIVEVVLLVDPPVLSVVQAVPLVRDVLQFNFRAFTVEEEALEQLNSQDTEYDKEGATDENNVADRF